MKGEVTVERSGGCDWLAGVTTRRANMMEKRSGVQYGSNRMPVVGLLCGMLVLLGLPVITLTFGAHLNEWIQVVMILLAFVVGGVMSIVAIFFGIVIPQVHYTRQEGTASAVPAGSADCEIKDGCIRVRNGGQEVRVDGGEVSVSPVEQPTQEP